MDKASADLKNTNVRLKDTVNQVSVFAAFLSLQMHIRVLFINKKNKKIKKSLLLDLMHVLFLLQLRSSRNFCIDIILLCVILGIAAYLYK